MWFLWLRWSRWLGFLGGGQQTIIILTFLGAPRNVGAPGKCLPQGASYVVTPLASIRLRCWLANCFVQVASTVLNIPVSYIHVVDTNVSTVPNSSPSAASTCSDLYGMAVVVISSFQWCIPSTALFTVINTYLEANCLRNCPIARSTGFYTVSQKNMWLHFLQ